MVQSGMHSKIIISIILIVVTLILGILLHKTGKPYSNILFTFHKLTTLAFIVLMVIELINYNKANTLGSILLIFIVIGIVALIGLLTSGTLLSLDKMEQSAKTIHKTSTFLFLISSIGIFYRFFIG